MGLKRDLTAAGLWGFAEATLFFIVPDVLLCFILLRAGLSRAALAAVVCATAATAGGAMMMVFALVHPGGAEEAVAAVPNVSLAMLAGVREALAKDGLASVFQGAFQGVPYKVYAVEAAIAGIDPLTFLASSVPARLLRFVATLLLVGCVSLALRRTKVRENHQAAGLGLAWLAFYVWYFTATPE